MNQPRGEGRPRRSDSGWRECATRCRCARAGKGAQRCCGCEAQASTADARDSAPAQRCYRLVQPPRVTSVRLHGVKGAASLRRWRRGASVPRPRGQGSAAQRHIHSGAAVLGAAGRTLLRDTSRASLATARASTRSGAAPRRRGAGAAAASGAALPSDRGRARLCVRARAASQHVASMATLLLVTPTQGARVPVCPRSTWHGRARGVDWCGTRNAHVGSVLAGRAQAH